MMTGSPYSLNLISYRTVLSLQTEISQKIDAENLWRSFYIELII